MSKLLPLYADDKIRQFNHSVATPEEIEQQIIWYFDYCGACDMRPGVEGLCLALNINRDTFNNWVNRKRQSKAVQDVAIRAHQALAAYTEYMFQHGKLNPATGIFLLKNWFGYQDVVVTEHREEKPQFGETISNDEIVNLIE